MKLFCFPHEKLQKTGCLSTVNIANRPPPAPPTEEGLDSNAAFIANKSPFPLGRAGVRSVRCNEKIPQRHGEHGEKNEEKAAQLG